MSFEIVFSRNDATGVSATELLQRLASKLGIEIGPQHHAGNGRIVLGDLGIAISLTFGEDKKPIVAIAEVSDETETSRVLALLRVFESLGWDS